MKLSYKNWIWCAITAVIIFGTIFKIPKTEAAQPPPPERWVLLVQDTTSIDGFKVSYKAESSGENPPGWTGPVTWTPQTRDLSAEEKQIALKVLTSINSFGIFLVESPFSESRKITKLSDTADLDKFKELKEAGDYVFSGYDIGQEKIEHLQEKYGLITTISVINIVFAIITLIIFGMTLYLFYLSIKFRQLYVEFYKILFEKMVLPHKKFFIAFVVVFIIIISLVIFVSLFYIDEYVLEPDAADGALSQAIEELNKKTAGLFAENAAMEKICANILAIGRPAISLWTNDRRAVIWLRPDFEQVTHGPDLYFNGDGEQVFAVQNRPLEINDVEAEIWNKQAKGLLLGLEETAKLSCQKIDPIMIP